MQREAERESSDGHDMLMRRHTVECNRVLSYVIHDRQLSVVSPLACLVESRTQVFCAS